MKIRIFLMAMAVLSQTARAQVTDKVEADRMLFETLSQASGCENYHEPLLVQADRLAETSAKGVYLMRGESFQVPSICSDCYLQKGADGQWQPVCDARYPMETAVNLLLNRLHDNGHRLALTHHQYGGKRQKATIPMQCLYDMLGRNMRMYCSVTRIDTQSMDAVLVFHHPGRNFIHMLQMRMATGKVHDNSYTIEADLYTNIPQNNLGSMFFKSQK